MRCTLPSRAFSAPLTWFTRVVCLVATLTFAVFASAQATDTGTGSITGRVLNISNGQYLSKAVVRVEGTDLSTLTNDFGEYTVRNVPAGERVVVASFTGIPAQSVTTTVLSGAAVTANISLGAAAATKSFEPQQEPTFTLDPYKVEAQRYQTAQQIAINEERYSVNIKNVVSADAFGDIAQGNVGEFVKYLPGVELNYGGTYTSPADATGISIRGFGAADTVIYVDGVPISSASPASLSNEVGLDMMSLNNASRVEIIKVPTPDMPANSIGGQINLISKSAFEYAKPTYTFRTFMTVNSEYADQLFKKVSGPSNKKYYSSLPGLDFTIAYPISKNLGFSVTGSHYEEFTAQRRLRPEFTTSNVTADLRPFGGANNTSLTNTSGPASLVNPFLSRISVTDSPRWQRRDSISLKGDWKPIKGLTLSGSYQYSTYDSADAARRMQFRIQRPQSWNSTSTISLPYLTSSQSATGSAFNPSNSLDMNIDSRDKTGFTHTGYFRAKYQQGPWDIEAVASVSSSKGSYKDTENGHFSTVDVSATIGQMKFEGFADGVPGSITILDRNGAPFDWTQLSKWNTPTIQARSGKSESLNDIWTYKADIRRELDFLPMSWVKLAFKTGYYREEKLDKKWGLGTGWRQTYAGPALTTSDYLDETYIGYSPGWIFPAQEWISTYRLYDLYVQNPGNFNADSESDKINNWNSTVNQNKRIKEVKDAWYAQFEGKALHDRLSFVAGLRQEKATRTGQGPMLDNDWNFIKNPDGTLYRNATFGGLVQINNSNSPLFAQNATGTALRADLTAKGIAFPTAPILSNTFAARQLQLRPLQSVRGESKGKPSYSISTSYEITKNLVGKLSYSRSFGRIDLENATVGLLSASNQFTLNESDDINATPRGVINVANPNLKPWISDNWDVGLYYYTDSGGKIGVSYFTKSVTNYQEKLSFASDSPVFNEVLGSLGLDPTYYADWRLDTAVNGPGKSKVTGYEIEVAQDLRFIPYLGDWGQRFYVFGNYSDKKRKQAPEILTNRPAADKTASAGLQFATTRFSMMVKATWTDLKLAQATSSVSYNGISYPMGIYSPSITKVDANANFQINKRVSIYASARDIFNSGDIRKRYEINSSLYPAYAQWDDIKEFGVNVSVGVKVQF